MAVGQASLESLQGTAKGPLRALQVPTCSTQIDHLAAGDQFCRGAMPPVLQKLSVAWHDKVPVQQYAMHLHTTRCMLPPAVMAAASAADKLPLPK